MGILEAAGDFYNVPKGVGSVSTWQTLFFFFYNPPHESWTVTHQASGAGNMLVGCSVSAAGRFEPKSKEASDSFSLVNWSPHQVAEKRRETKQN